MFRMPSGVTSHLKQHPFFSLCWGNRKMSLYIFQSPVIWHSGAEQPIRPRSLFLCTSSAVQGVPSWRHVV